MHEMSLCESILGVLQQQAEQQSYQRVKTVFLEIGDLANVEIEALRFSFDAVMHGTLADQAQLEIFQVPAKAWCLACGKSIAVQQLYDACPECGSFQLEISDGQQMRIKELEVE